MEGGPDVKTSLLREAPYEGPGLRVCWPVWVLTWCVVGVVR